MKINRAPMAGVVMVLGLAGACGGSGSQQPALTGALSVSVSSAHACAVMANGTATCWGDDAFGELGSGQMGIPVPTPTMVEGLTGIKAITAGASYTCALLADGSVACWGSNVSCQIGTCSSPEPVLSPTTVTGLSAPAMAIQASSLLGDSTGFTCALLGDGSVSCWGEDLLGLGSDPSARGVTPTAVAGVANATGMAIGGTFGCDLQPRGTVECWGTGPLGQPGTNFNSTSTTPVAVSGLSNARAIAAGFFHACALLNDGTVSCWGSNSSGQLGDGTRTDSALPVQVSGLTGAVAISTTGYATCAILADGSLQCWGIDLSKLTPSSISGVSGATSVSAAELTICSVVAGGEVRCWGNNEYGQLGNGVYPATTTTDLTSPPVTVVAGR
jgi:alpha-tubulin suppressor-like RCC1 family protein